MICLFASYLDQRLSRVRQDDDEGNQRSNVSKKNIQCTRNIDHRNQLDEDEERSSRIAVRQREIYSGEVNQVFLHRCFDVFPIVAAFRLDFGVLRRFQTKKSIETRKKFFQTDTNDRVER